MSAAVVNNEEIVLASRPQGVPVESDWKVQPVASLPALKDGEVLLQAKYISVDPYLRGRIREHKLGTLARCVTVCSGSAVQCSWRWICIAFECAASSADVSSVCCSSCTRWRSVMHAGETMVSGVVAEVVDDTPNSEFKVLDVAL